MWKARLGLEDAPGMEGTSRQESHSLVPGPGALAGQELKLPCLWDLRDAGEVTFHFLLTFADQKSENEKTVKRQ